MTTFMYNLLVDGEPARSKHAVKLAILEDAEQVTVENPATFAYNGSVNEFVQEGDEIEFEINGTCGSVARKRGRLVVR